MTTDSYMFDQIANPKMKTRTSYENGDQVAFVGLKKKDTQDIHVTIVHENDSEELFGQYKYKKKVKGIYLFERKV